MKAIKYLFASLMLISFLTGCKKTEEEIAPVLTINPAQKDIEANQGSFVIAVASTVKWTASSDKSWLTINPVSGNGDATIQVDYQLNSSAANRTALITFKGINVEDKVLTVTQLGIQPILTVSPANLSVAADAGNAVINITSNLSWTVTSNQTWCTVAQSSGIGNADLTLNYQPNTNQSQRTAIITFAANGVTNQTVQVTQAAFVPVLSVAPTSQTVNSPSGSAIFNVTSNITWAATCAETWCTLANPGGTNNGTLTVVYEENTTAGPRTATINVTGEGVTSQSVTLTQTNLIPTLSVTPSNRDVASTTGSTTFEITSNSAWTAQSDMTWCTIQNTTGSGNATLNVSFEENTSNDQRIASITLSANGVASQIATVTQQGAIPTDGLVAWYPFNGNANDESGNNNGTLNGSPALVSDRKGNQNASYYFNGVNDWISTNNILLTGPFTVSVWIKTNVAPTALFGGIISTGRINGNDGNGFNFFLAKDFPLIRYGKFPGSEGFQIVSNISLFDNFWHHVVFTWDGQTNLGTNAKLYNDIELIGQAVCLSNTLNSTKNFTIGKGNHESGDYFFQGIIDDIRVYNRVLTPSEIQQLYNE